MLAPDVPLWPDTVATFYAEHACAIRSHDTRKTRGYTYAQLPAGCKASHGRSSGDASSTRTSGVASISAGPSRSSLPTRARQVASRCPSL